jgi:hypothetical protein
LITNLVFCWVGFHAHTFSAIPFAGYWHFRPTILKTKISDNKDEWKSYNIGDEVPHTKILMEASKLT